MLIAQSWHKFCNSFSLSASKPNLSWAAHFITFIVEIIKFVKNLKVLASSCPTHSPVMMGPPPLSHVWSNGGQEWSNWRAQKECWHQIQHLWSGQQMWMCRSSNYQDLNSFFEIFLATLLIQRLIEWRKASLWLLGSRPPWCWGSWSWPTPTPSLRWRTPSTSPMTRPSTGSALIWQRGAKVLSTHVLSVMCLNSEPTLYRAGCEYDESSRQHQCKLLPFLSAQDQEGDAQNWISPFIFQMSTLNLFKLMPTSLHTVLYTLVQ